MAKPSKTKHATSYVTNEKYVRSITCFYSRSTILLLLIFPGDERITNDDSSDDMETFNGIPELHSSLFDADVVESSSGKPPAPCSTKPSSVAKIITVVFEHSSNRFLPARRVDSNIIFTASILDGEEDDFRSNVSLDELLNPQDHGDQDSSESSSKRCNDNEQAFLNKVVEFIRLANLNKTTTSELLSLLRSTGTGHNLPRTIDQLWTRMNISFNYETYIYCSVCFKQLNTCHDRCSLCSSSNSIQNSELIVYSINDELRRVLESNIELIEWYAQPKNRLVSDVVNGKSVS
jgi:hypothetical protein